MKNCTCAPYYLNYRLQLQQHHNWDEITITEPLRIPFHTDIPQEPHAASADTGLLQIQSAQHEFCLDVRRGLHWS